jgi:hypothetical protein
MSSTTNARWHWRQWHNSDLERGHGQAPQEVVNSAMAGLQVKWRMPWAPSQTAGGRRKGRVFWTVHVTTIENIINSGSKLPSEAILGPLLIIVLELLQILEYLQQL